MGPSPIPGVMDLYPYNYHILFVEGSERDLHILVGLPYLKLSLQNLMQSRVLSVDM